MRLLTAGHGNLAGEQLTELLRDADVQLVVDVRIAPGSRRNPQFARAALEQALPGAGVGYRWERRLGGFREPPDPSPDTGIEEPGLRGYAAHMRGAEFREAMRLLLEDAAARPTAVLCSEARWHSCHRRLIADAAVLLHGVDVRHIRHDGSLEGHAPDPAARVTGVGLIYDAGQTPPLF
jgi:uncharacterized protein (DUF488 family)